MSKVVVLGATGLIGYHLCKRLSEEGHEVRGTTHNRSHPKLPNVDYIHADLTRIEHCHWAMENGAEYVFQCAASVNGAWSAANDPLGAIHHNTLLYTSAIQAAADFGVKKYFSLGSTTAYPLSDYPMTEDRIFDEPLFDKYKPVAEVKRFNERLCQLYSQKMTVVSIRPTNVYGPYDNFNFGKSHVLPALIRRVVERQDPIEVWGDGSELRDLVYVDDMVEAIVRCMKLDGYHAVNVGSGRLHSIKEMLEMCMDAENFHPEVKFDENKPRMIPVRRVDLSKAKELLGFEAKVRLRDGIKKTADWFRENKETARR
jgi:GDP-L-fucose synthase